MNVTFAQLFTIRPQRTRRRFAPAIVVVLGVFFLTAVPALADGVRIGQVVQTLTNSQARPELKLSTLVTQDPVNSGTKTPTQQNGSTKPSQVGNGTEVGVSGVTISGEGTTIGVDTIEVEAGEVEGTICDCGEILVAGGAFPKWPFLFLAAVPLVFINECDDCDQKQSSPTPTPTPTPPSNPTPTPPSSEVPEPASLLLFGTGLAAAGASLRRRYSKAKQVNSKEEEE